jgi:hypothetical protein
MGSRWASRVAAAMWLAAPPAAAQQLSEFGPQVIGTASDPGLVVAGGYGALQTSPRTRLSFGAGAGISGDAFAWRAEVLEHFLLQPQRRTGVGFYGAGGVAVVGGSVDQGYLVLTLGVEARPGSPGGWFVEAGLGGGARLAAGYRWRRTPRSRWSGP